MDKVTGYGLRVTVICLIFLCFSLVCHLQPTTSFAHVLKANGSVGAVMHVTPDDDPIAGEQSDFYFEFKDKEGRFRPEDCSCNISVSDSSGKELLNKPLFSGNANPSLTNASLSFTFPQRGVYKIKITGKPITAGEFNDFNLEYDLRVERVSDGSNSADRTLEDGNKNWVLTHIPHIIGSVLVLGFLIFAILKGRLGKGKSGT